MKAVMGVFVVGMLFACLFLALMAEGDVDNITGAVGEIKKTQSEISSSVQSNTGTESYGVIGETGKFFCETVRGGQWSMAIGACYVGQ